MGMGYVWIDGETVESSAAADRCGVYVLERVHTLDYRVRRLAEHLARLRAACEQAFGFAPICSVGDLADDIAGLLARNRMTRRVSCPVKISVAADARMIVECESATFGAGCYLRAKMPSLAALQYDMPMPWGGYPSSLSEQAEALADLRVRISGAEKAIRLDGRMMIAGSPWSVPFLVKDNHVFAPSESTSVEYLTACEAIRAAGLPLHVRALSHRALDNADEIFTVDIMGMTSYSRIGRRPLSSTAASRIASYFR